MVERRRPLAVKEAIERVMRYSVLGEKEQVSLRESYGRFLAEDLIADHPVPPFDRSPYDGFAIRSIDSKLASTDQPVEFEVIDEIGAGSVSEFVLGEMQAIRIMTGAQLPNGCDAVVMLELTKVFEKEEKVFMSIKRPFNSGDNISFEGEDTPQGSTLVKKGAYITPGTIALLATFGYATVTVIKKPTIGIIATGSELLDVGEQLVPGKIRNSNSFMIEAQTRRSGAEPIYLGKLMDDIDECYEAIKNALSNVDFLITTGGVSVGDYDYLPEIYKRLGANVLFNKVAMRPGSVTTVAEYNGKLLFGLSGNPSACYVGFELFVRPIVRSYLSSEKPHLRKVTANLGKDFLKANPFTRFVRGKLSFAKGELIASPVGLDKSNVVTSLAESNAFIVLPGGTRGFQTGDQVDVLLVEEQIGSEISWAESFK
ncbi:MULTISPECIES: gephyrin-like molybdotransferase Glp [Metabacillus]|jgi:molybdopterin molybdotransferase|uniref:Molybdopterin molybdenumtransferase n=1 Tax=Metabacillus rhizolycopersici TaxID=2875709 RepID=A0ABS7UKZ5_9BACI|nr:MULTISPECIES: gephyrin-like molybdotransferase Glp [Metabacillus]MBZ5748826.1 molybdopterin molybdotransferase MoeA [Metabacillus rhizolycopersici]MCM3652444.1 molybdopterin molybdotransferase MoeA [Metabacillus litoralis]